MNAECEAKLRAALGLIPVRLVFMFVVLAVIDVAFQIAPQLLSPKGPGPAREAVQLAGALVLSAAMVAAYRYLVRCTEGRAADELRLRGAAASVAVGAAAGAAMFGLVYAVLYLLDAVSIQGLRGFSGVGFALAIAVASAVGEEIVFRGVIFRLLEEGMGTAIAVALSAGAFGLLHAGNHGATWISTVAIAVESGVLMGLAYAATRSLWLPIGVHFGWNFTEGGVFGAAVSGGQYKGLLAAPLAGPSALTGGEFGPEASVIAMAVSVLASSWLAWFAIRRGGWRPPRWTMKSPSP